MTSRERVETALDHREPDRTPIDLGSTTVTGMHASTVYRLRQALALDPPGTPIRVVEPVQMLGEIDDRLLTALGIDVVGVRGTRCKFGFALEHWKEWRLFDGTPVLVPGEFNTAVEPDGSIVQFPQGDPSAPASGRMPAGGWYFDAIVRQEPIDESRLDPSDNLEEFGPISRADLDWMEAETRRREPGGRAIVLAIGGTAFGDISNVPAPMLRRPRGIRDVEEWYVSILTRPGYVRQIFERQCEIALANLAAVHKRTAGRVSALYLTGTDFGAQRGAFVSPAIYRDLFLPFHKALTDWVHRNTGWKCFIHSCGSVVELIPLFLEAGFDILNPVQVSAAGMDPAVLKERFGDRLCFWGGGVDTQRTLPFGTAQEVERQVSERIRRFSRGGGYVFNPIHNVQAAVPVENILAMFEAARRAG